MVREPTTDAIIIGKLHRPPVDRDHVHRPRSHGPPAEAFIIYDESASPCADDYIIDADYPIETYL